jgi:hypothetical protein
LNFGSGSSGVVELANRGALVVLLHVAIERLDVEAQLAEVGGLELVDLQLEGHQALQRAMEEQ